MLIDTHVTTAFRCFHQNSDGCVNTGPCFWLGLCSILRSWKSLSQLQMITCLIPNSMWQHSKNKAAIQRDIPLSSSHFMSYMSRKYTHIRTHPGSLFWKSSGWAGLQALREKKERKNCNRRHQALFNIQLIWNLLVCSIPAVSGQLPTWWKALLLSFLGRSVAIVCVCVFPSKHVNQQEMQAMFE